MFGAQQHLRRCHAVQHHAAHVLGIIAQIHLCRARAVRNTDQVDLAKPQRLAYRFNVAGCYGGCIKARIGIQFGQAFACILTDFVEIDVGDEFRFAQGALQFVGAAGAALIDQNHIAMFVRLTQRAGNNRPGFRGRLAGSTGKKENRIVCLLFRVAGRYAGNAQADAARAAVVTGFSQRLGRIFGHQQAATLGLGGERGARQAQICSR